MELEDYVSESLKQIINGVKGAQESANQLGAEISPTGNREAEVEFDIAIVSSEQKGAHGGFNHRVASIGGEAGKRTEQQDISENRVRFSVRVTLAKQTEANLKVAK